MKKGVGQFETKHLKWDEFRRVLKCLEQDGDIQWKCLLALGVFFALRVSDLVEIKWSDIWKDGKPVKSFEVWEIKTRRKKTKPRVITLSQDAQDLIQELRDACNPYDYREYVYNSLSRADSISDVRWVNKNLKRIFVKYNVDYDGLVSSHLFRKTFGHQYAKIHNFSAESIIHLNQVFRHSSIRDTMVYLGINNTQIAGVYVDVCRL
jgi:integrase